MRIINLSAGLSLYDIRTAFPVGDLELYVNGLPNTNGDFRFIAFVNENKIGEYTLARDHNNITIPRKLISAGVFSCYISHYIGETEVKRYNVENLVITDINTDYSAMPEITALKDSITALSNKADELSKALTEANTAREEQAKKIAELAEEQTDTNELIGKILKWAYNVESNVPFLDGGTEAEFYNKFGIKGDNNEQ